MIITNEVYKKDFMVGCNQVIVRMSFSDQKWFYVVSQAN